MFRAVISKGIFIALITSLLLGVSMVRAQSANNRRVDVTLNEGTSLAIALSPDGTTLAMDLVGSLWTVSAAGGPARRITDESSDVRQPTWFPDGQTLAFQSFRLGSWDIWSVGAGLSPYEALQSATLAAAEALGAERDLGSIEAGKLADLVILDGDPLADIKNARKVQRVVKNGEVFDLETLLGKE